MLSLLRARWIALGTLLATLLVSVPAALAQMPDDPWPRSIDLGSGATATLYQPQVESWEGNRLGFRAAVKISEPGPSQERVGTVWATAVTRVDRISRLVTLDDVSFTRSTLPVLAERGTSSLSALQLQLERVPQIIALDRLQASLASAREIKPVGLSVQNTPPRIFVSDTPALLILIAGTPVLRPVAGTPLERVVNTRALILRDAGRYYVLLGDAWMVADALDGSWYPTERVPAAVERVAATLASTLDLAAGGAARSAQQGPPTLFVSQTPAALLVFDGEPMLEPIPGTTLMRAANTTSNVIVDIVSGRYYLLLAGRWFRAPALNGPWTYVSARALPRDFAAIPADDPAGVVLASVPGTPQAQQALLEAATPQTATVPRTNGPTFAPEFDGHPQYRPIAGTAMSYVANSPHPVIRVDGRRYFALKAGVWFEAASAFGPWSLATAVPDVVYTIPVTSPLHRVTYVRIFSATSQVVETGYTDGYLGSVVTPEGVVVQGSGYVYLPWIGNAFLPVPVTYGGSAQRRDDVARNVYAQWGGAVYTGLRAYRYVAGGMPRSALVESFAAAGGENDHYADSNGAVWRSRGGIWERHGARGWERAAPEQCVWASNEREARAIGAQRFERHRAREGMERFAEDSTTTERRDNAVVSGNVHIGGVRSRRTAP